MSEKVGSFLPRKLHLVMLAEFTPCSLNFVELLTFKQYSGSDRLKMYLGKPTAFVVFSHSQLLRIVF